MKKNILLLSAMGALRTILTLQTVFAQPVTQEWARRYDSPYHLNDISVAVAVDKFGNSYVTGYCFKPTLEKEIATVKYDQQGVLQWVGIYADTTMPENFAIGIVVDTSSNAYITGWSGNINSNIYYAWIVKYNSNGDSLWTKRYYGMEQYVFPSAITVDKFNNIYITGTDYSNTQPDQTFTIKYSVNGDSLWTRIHRETGYSGNGSNSVAVDRTGNVFIGGVSWFSSSIYDYLIVKYNSAGIRQWSKTYGVSNQNDFAYKIAVDNNSNVCITGYGYNTNTNDYYDYLTVKYNSGGDLQWARMYSRGVDEAYDITFDFLGNVIVTGKSSIPGNGPDFCTIKYNPAGDSQWVRIYNGSSNLDDIAYYVLTDSLGNVYVTGNSRFSSNNGYLTTIKYSNIGIQQWLMQFVGGMQGGLLHGQGIAMDYLKNIFVIGSNNEASTGSDYITIKYTQFVGIQSVSNEIPSVFKLEQNFPNPFNSTTIIAFSIPKRSLVQIQIYDLLGRLTDIPVNEEIEASEYELRIDAANYSSGVYFYRLIANGKMIDTKKFILLK